MHGSISNIRGGVLNLYSPPKLLFDGVIFIDGLTRSGKFLLAKLVSNFGDVEYFQHQPIIEHLPILRTIKLIGDEEADSLLRLYLNNAVYDRLVGRNLNSRDESSGIQNAYDPQRYFSRGKGPDGQRAIDIATRENRVPSFLVHECLPHVDFFSRSVPLMQMIHIQRHPLDLCLSWYKRGWAERWGYDPLAFIPAVDISGTPVPWFAVNWADDWIALGHKPMNRVIGAVTTLHSLENDAYNKFAHPKKILRLCYEHLFIDPLSAVRQIECFLNRSPLPNMEDVLTREGCPNPDLAVINEKKVAKIRALCSDDYYERIAIASQEYEARWELKSTHIK